jgi:YihY family inner membrane protein
VSEQGPSRSVGQRVKDAVSEVDDAQRRHPWSAVTVAVLKKFGDDRGGNWAALIAYYGFFSLFPLLLAFTTVLGFVVQGDPELQQRLVDSAIANFPIIGDQIRGNVEALQGSIPALVIGVVGAVWAGLAVVLTLQTAMNEVWDVPRRERPNFLKARLRALLALLALGVAIAVSSVLAGLGGSAGELPIPLRALSLLGTLAVNVALFAAAFRYLTVAEVRWRDVLPGAVAAGIAWMVLLALGSWLVTRQIQGAEQLYGFFAIVIGLLAWFSLGAQMMLLAAELNVVLARRLWPRSLSPPPLTEQDREVFAAQARAEAVRPDIDVTFEPPDAPTVRGPRPRSEPGPGV